MGREDTEPTDYTSIIPTSSAEEAAEDAGWTGRHVELLRLGERRVHNLSHWEVGEARRDDETVTWDLARPADEVYGYVRMGADGLAQVRIIYWVGPASAVVESRLALLPEPLVGRFDIQQDNDDLVSSLWASIDMAVPNRLESVLEHFASIVRHQTSNELVKGEEALSDLKQTLREAKLPVPAVARELSNLRRLGPWWWATGFVPAFDMYMHESERMMLGLWNQCPMFALSHAGHGVNSYGLNIVCAIGPVAVVAQIGWGGAYMDDVRARSEIAQLFGLIDGLPRASYAVPRVLVSYSSFRGTARYWTLDDLVPEPADVDLGGTAKDLGRLFSEPSGAARW